MLVFGTEICTSPQFHAVSCISYQPQEANSTEDYLGQLDHFPTLTPDLPPQASANLVSACLSPLQYPPGSSTSQSPKFRPQSGSRCSTCRQTETCVGSHRNLECCA